MFDLKKFADNIAIISDKGEKISYQALHDRTEQMVKSLDRGFAFCLCSNTVDSIVGYISFLNNKIPALLLDTEINTEALENLLSIYTPRYIWKPKVKHPDIEGKEKHSSAEYHLIDTGEPYSLSSSLALCLTTSGSTGSPKLVRLSAENLVSNAESIIEYLDIRETDRPVTSLPMHYSFGMSVINSHLYTGATLLLTDKSIMQKDFWEFVRNERATSFSGVPYTYEMLRRLRFFRMDLPYLTTLTQAGGKLNEKIVKEFADFSLEAGKRFFVMYGQTEASPRMSYLTTEEASLRPSSIGKAIPGGKFQIVDAEGNLVDKPFVDGELVFRGKNVCLGYAESREDLEKEDENHGVLHTGDVAHFDEEGFYYITGRLKRFVKIWGNRCSLDALEQIVKEKTPEAVCVGEDNKVTVVVSGKDEISGIKEMLVERTGFHPSAFSVVRIDEIPKNTSGKVLYENLKKILKG